MGTTNRDAFGSGNGSVRPMIAGARCRAARFTTRVRSVGGPLFGSNRRSVTSQIQEATNKGSSLGRITKGGTTPMHIKPIADAIYDPKV